MTFTLADFFGSNTCKVTKSYIPPDAVHISQEKFMRNAIFELLLTFHVEINNFENSLPFSIRLLKAKTKFWFSILIDYFCKNMTIHLFFSCEQNHHILMLEVNYFIFHPPFIRHHNTMQKVLILNRVLAPKVATFWNISYNKNSEELFQPQLTIEILLILLFKSYHNLNVILQLIFPKQQQKQETAKWPKLWNAFKLVIRFLVLCYITPYFASPVISVSGKERGWKVNQWNCQCFTPPNLLYWFILTLIF